MDLIITKLERDVDGHWSARVTPCGQATVPVTRRFGSWGTVPGDDGRWGDLPPAWPAALQERVRPLERREHIEAHARGEHAARVRRCPECRKGAGA